MSALGSFEATATNFLGNTAAQGGSHIYNSGDVSLAKGSGVDGDDDKGLFNGNRLEYILPAPLGRYLSGVFQCKEFLCSTVFGLVPCSNQPCNASLQHGAYMALSAQGYIPAPYPPLCVIGAYGDSLAVKEQSSSTSHPPQIRH